MRHIIILGMNFQGLFFLRELAKKRYNLHCIGRNQEEIGMYSRYGKKYVAANGMALRQVVAEILFEETRLRSYILTSVSSLFSMPSFFYRNMMV
jgi:hypothetical protein